MGANLSASSYVTHHKVFVPPVEGRESREALRMLRAIASPSLDERPGLWGERVKVNRPVDRSSVIDAHDPNEKGDDDGGDGWKKRKWKNDLAHIISADTKTRRGAFEESQILA